MKDSIEQLLSKFTVGLPEFEANRVPRVVTIFDGSLGYDLSVAFARYYRDYWSIDNPAIPLFVVVDQEVRIRGGFSVPSELTLSTFELEKLPARGKQLLLMHPEGISEGDLRAFCVGAFRRFLGLGDDNHGRGELDLTELLSGEYLNPKTDAFRRWMDEKEGWAAIYRDRLGEDNVDHVATMYRGMFRKERQELQSKMEELNQSIRRLATELGLFE